MWNVRETTTWPRYFCFKWQLESTLPSPADPYNINFFLINNIAHEKYSWHYHSYVRLAEKSMWRYEFLKRGICRTFLQHTVCGSWHKFVFEELYWLHAGAPPIGTPHSFSHCSPNSIRYSFKNVCLSPCLSGSSYHQLFCTTKMIDSLHKNKQLSGVGGLCVK